MVDENWFDTQAMLKVQSLKKTGVTQSSPAQNFSKMPAQNLNEQQVSANQTKTTAPPNAAPVTNDEKNTNEAQNMLQPAVHSELSGWLTKDNPALQPEALQSLPPKNKEVPPQKSLGWVQTLKEKLSQLSLTKMFASKNNKIAFAVIALAISLIFVLNLSGTFSTDADTATTTFNSLEYVSSAVYTANLEEKLTQVLSKIKGAGSVTVMVTLESGPELKIATSVDEKKTTSTSTSTTTTNVTVVETPIIITQNGESTPLVLMEIMPVIKGVVVVAQGAGDTKVKLQLLEAVQSLLEVESNNIQIYASI